jgi:hypothetical protein
MQQLTGRQTDERGLHIITFYFVQNALKEVQHLQGATEVFDMSYTG